MFDTGDEDLTQEADPKKLLVILDYDEICYRLKDSQFPYFKTAFALTAINLLPNFNSVIPADDRSFYEQECYDINNSDISQLEKDHKITLKQAFYTAVAGWNDHKDCTYYFTEHMDDAAKDRLREDFDRMAHSILPTHLWEPIKGLRQDIQELREMGAEVVIWTHGRREMVMRTQQQNDLDWLFMMHEIFDKQSRLGDGQAIGRKDKGPESYTRFCKQKGVLPENTVLVDDTKDNHKSAAQAGIGLRVWVDWYKQSQKAIIDFPKVKVDDTASGMKHVKKFIRDRNAELGNIPDAANEASEPRGLPKRAAGHRL